MRQTFAIVVLLLAMGLSLLQPPKARAGFCSGDSARIRRFFEVLANRVYKSLSHFHDGIYLVWRNTRGYLPSFSLWSLYLKSRADLAGLLIPADADPRSPTDAKQVFLTLEPHWKKANEIRRYFFQREIEVQPNLEGAIRELVIRWSPCQAVKTARPEPCDLIGSQDPKGRHEDCLNAVALYGILYANRCSDENVEFAAKTIKMSPNSLRESCRILAAQQSERCRSVPDFSPLEIQLCLALTGQGEAVCKQTQSAEKDCLQNVYIYQVITGRRSLEDWEQTEPSEILRIAVRSAAGRENCLQLALRQYDMHAQGFFLLDTEKWYLPP